ncbi:MAG: DUF2520 domain-containing protein [Planctomycetes bacterium]|nr:DUF2520 domain-containing protein [Planctomycetota bacterium]
MPIKKTNISIIGAGKVGKTIGYLLARKRYCINYIINKNYSSSKSACRFIGSGKALPSISSDMQQSDLIIITVPDSEIIRVCKRLTDAKAIRNGQLLIHCSGSQSSSIIKCAKKIVVGSIHFVYSFADPSLAVKTLSGSYAVYEGDEKATSRIMAVIKDLKTIPIRIKPREKLVYHSACVFASNFVVTLESIGVKLMQGSGINELNAVKILLSLSKQTLFNIDKCGVFNALTGPVERGDVKTVLGHLKYIPRRYKSIYKLLTRLTVDVARKKGISYSRVRAISKIL